VEKPYLKLGPEEIDEIIAMTTDRGPIEDDLFYLIFAGDRFWQVGMLEAEELFDWFGKFPDFDFEKSIRASTCTENRRFILWSKTGPRGVGEKTGDVLSARLTALLASANSNWGLGPSDSDSRIKIAAEVIQKYREPSRHYHGLAHIKHCLWELDQIPEGLVLGDGPHANIRDFRAKIELAIWFHDVIYDPRSKTNEHDSAKFFTSSLAEDSGTGLPEVKNSEGARAVEEISEMIELSNHRQPVTDNKSALAYFLDIDMAILGRPEIHYGEYAQNVRLEYEHVPSLVYSHYRKKFLNAVLRHGAFQTEWFKDKYLNSSNANMKSEFEGLHPRWIPPWKMVEF
jgi:predicted metal-dependent HD superfamily phosphohydrolase